MFGDDPLVTLLGKYFSDFLHCFQGFPVHTRATETYRNERPCKLVLLFLKTKPVTVMKTNLNGIYLFRVQSKVARRTLF